MENLGIDVKILVAQLLNFILFFILIKKFMVKPFLSFLDKEKKLDKDKQEALARIKISEEELIKSQEKAKEKAKKELEAFLQKTKKDSQQVKDELLQEAKKEAEEIKVRMEKQLIEERESLYRDIKKQIAEVSISLVSEGLKSALDESDKSKVTKKILDNLDDKKFI